MGFLILFWNKPNQKQNTSPWAWHCWGMQIADTGACPAAMKFLACCHTASQCRGCGWPPASGCCPWALCKSWTAGSLPMTPGPRWPAASCTDWADRAPPCTGSPPMHGSHSCTLMVLICLFWLTTLLLISNICMLVFWLIWAGGWWCHKCQTGHHEKQIFQLNNNNYLTMVIKANLLTKNDLFPSHSIFWSCFYLLKQAKLFWAYPWGFIDYRL